MPETVIDCSVNTFQLTQQEIDGQIEDLLLAHKVINSKQPNKFGCRIPVKTHVNLYKFKELLQGYHDLEVIDWLTFGFSVSRHLNQHDLTPANINHTGANQFPQAIKQYLFNEIRLNAMLGPFTLPPFLSRIGISPLNTRPKRNSDKRCVILDLSFPHGNSVNDGIQKDWYCGEQIKLKYPTIDDMARRVFEVGTTCLLFKCDLARFFRQIPLCPLDWSLTGMHWENMLFFDKVFPMGLCRAAYCCQ